MEEFSNETIYMLLKTFKDNTETHLKELNGAVKKNTGFRQKAIGGFAVISFIGAIMIYKIFTR